MMRCARVRKFLPLYLDRRLGPRLLAGIDAHLADCHACQAELGDLREAVEVVRSLPALATPPRFHSAVVAALREAAYERDRGRIASPPLRVLKPAAAIAGVALAVAVTAFLVTRGGPHAGPVGPVAVGPSLPAPNAPVAGEPGVEPAPGITVAQVLAPPEPRVVQAHSEPAVAAASRTGPRARQRNEAVAVRHAAKGAAEKAGSAKAPSRDVTFAACLLGSIVVSEVVQPAAVQPEVQDPDFQRELVLTAWPPQPDIAPAASPAPQLAELTSRNFN